MISRTLVPFLPRSQPWITRQSYTHELVNVLTFPIALAMVEGGVVGVLATKAFNVNPFLFATIMAAPMFANLTSFIWARLARGKPKVRVINRLQVLMLLCVGSIAILPTPDSPGPVLAAFQRLTGLELAPLAQAGPVLLTLLVVLARCTVSGVVTIRSTVWRMNYPRAVRARVTGRLALINALILAFAPLLGYMLLDMTPDAFRLVYPASVLVAFMGVLAFSRVRLRGQRDLLRYENSQAAKPTPHGIPGPIYEYDPKNQSAGRANFWSVLKQDHFFRTYMLWQFFAGVSNMTGEVIVIYLIAELTTGLNFEYLTSIVLTTAIPMVLATLTMPLWARQLDRMHVAEFRARQGWYWIANQSVNWVGALIAAVWTGSVLAPLLVLLVARLVQGIARGGGMLAWNLGHNDFADRRLVATYMGIHVTLTGIRGAIAPFLGMALYVGWDAQSLFGVQVLPAFQGIGYHIFIITTAFAVASEFGFKKLHRDIRRTHQADASAS